MTFSTAVVSSLILLGQTYWTHLLRSSAAIEVRWCMTAGAVCVVAPMVRSFGLGLWQLTRQLC
jgi:hypothetical protein